MSTRRKPRQAASPDRSTAIPTPALRIPHLAEAAKRHGTEERVIWVDAPAPPQVKTPGRTVGQWLKSGERLPEIGPAGETTGADASGPVSGASSSALAGCADKGNALADAMSRSAEREGMER